MSGTRYLLAKYLTSTWLLIIVIMKNLQDILKEIDQLRPEELELILKRINDRINRKRKLENAFEEYIGAAKGFWEMDAQEYINDSRTEDDNKKEVA